MSASACSPRGSRRLSLAAALIAALPTVCLGQADPEPPDGDTAALRPGARVRVWAPSYHPGRLEGFVEAVDGEVLVLSKRRGATLISVSVDAVERLEVQHRSGVRSRGARIGAIAGGAVGLAVGLVGATTVEDCTGGFCFDGLERFLWISGGATAGALVGGGIGAAAAGDGWRVVETGRVRAGLGAAGLGVRLFASLVP